MNTFTIKPLLGLKSAVPHNDPTLFQMVSEGTAITHCVDGLNFDLQKKRNAISKSTYMNAWSNTAAASANRCHGIYYLDDGSSTSEWIFTSDGTNGRVFRYDSARDPVRISDVVGHSGAVEFAADAMDLYSVIRVGNHMVFSDYGEHTPYCSDSNDTTLSKLISTGTEFEPRYLEYFQRRIIAAHCTDQTNGDIEIRWSGALPTPGTSCEFTAASQLYKPDDDPISGIKRMGMDSCFLYGENSIDRIDYYPNYTSPFSIRNVISGQGTTNHASIVNANKMHYFYNRNYGFCRFDGQTFSPISDDIEDKITAINNDFAGHIVGEHIPSIDKIAWTVPLDGSAVPTHIIYFNLQTGTWEVEDKAARFIAYWPVATDVTWTDLGTLGYTTWTSLGTLRWGEVASSTNGMVLSDTNGHIYHKIGDGSAGVSYDGYFITPVLDFGRPEDKDLLLEIWFSFAEVGNYSLDTYYRGGDTEGAVRAASWSNLDAVSANSPDYPVIRLSETNKMHQLKIGTDGGQKPFCINSIQFKYVDQGRY